jgi:ABC-type dipeptide/oligopeptide/nickel transport system permease subunit
METTAPPLVQVKKVRRSNSLAKAWYRFTRRKAAVVALGFILFQVILGLGGPLMVKAKLIIDPYFTDYTVTWKAPSAAHWFGTDDFGRDVFARVIFGARVSYAVGVGSTVIVTIIGLIIGALSGLIGGWLDYLIMRIIDILSSIPMLLLYILLMIALGAGLVNIILAMSIAGWIGVARLVRGQVLSLKQTDYVRAATSMGAKTSEIVSAHILRNSMTPVIISATLGVPGAMFGEAGLSFLGLGIAPPTPSWGQMIGQYQSFVRTAPWLVVMPAIVLAITMLAWILIGDGLRDALDPNIRV